MSLFPIFLVGLLGSVHCVGMCGGIVGAFSTGGRRHKVIAIAADPRSAAAGGSLSHALAYNAGRLASYATAGAIAGGMAHSLRTISLLAPLQIGGYWLANLMLVALGLHLMNAWHGLSRVEALGRGLWSSLQPLLPRLLPADTPGKVFALGMLWGWVPCGMVYSVLLTALTSGSAAAGSAVMLAFGLGTLPMMLSLGVLGARLKSLANQGMARKLGGAVVLAFGLLGLARAASGLPHAWLDGLCLTPPAAQETVR